MRLAPQYLTGSSSARTFARGDTARPTRLSPSASGSVELPLTGSPYARQRDTGDGDGPTWILETRLKNSLRLKVGYSPGRAENEVGVAPDEAVAQEWPLLIIVCGIPRSGMRQTEVSEVNDGVSTRSPLK